MTTDNSAQSQLPQVLDVRALKKHFGLGRTTAYLLATAGEITSLTIGRPGTRGKRAFLTESVLAYIKRRVENAKPLNCKVKKPSEAPGAQKTAARHSSESDSAV